MPKVIGVVQIKGGTGRSTLATNLAGELAKRAKTVLLDCDMPQGTSASWFAVRQQRMAIADLISGLVADTASNHRELVAKVEQHANADYIVLDGPPRGAELTKAILVLADLCLCPVGASVAEIWATGDLLELVKQANQIKTVDARMVWTRYRANTRLAQELSALAGSTLGLTPLSASMALRVAYTEALGRGLTVAELADASAKAEVKALTDEIENLLPRKNHEQTH